MKLEDITHIEFDINTTCNMLCYHCHGRKENKVISLEFNDILFSNLKKLINLKNILICGTKGEPFLHPHFEDLLCFFKNEFPDASVSIATNGTIYKNLKHCISKKHNIEIAIDGSTSIIHNITRPSNNKNILNVIDKNIKLFFNDGLSLKIIFTAYSHNESDFINVKNKYNDIECSIRGTRYAEKFKYPSFSYSVKSILLHGTMNDSTYKFFSKQVKLQPMFNTKIFINAEGYILPCNEYDKFNLIKYNNITKEDIFLNELSTMCDSFRTHNDRRQCLITCGIEKEF